MFPIFSYDFLWFPYEIVKRSPIGSCGNHLNSSNKSVFSRRVVWEFIFKKIEGFSTGARIGIRFQIQKVWAKPLANTKPQYVSCFGIHYLYVCCNIKNIWHLRNLKSLMFYLILALFLPFSTMDLLPPWHPW